MLESFMLLRHAEAQSNYGKYFAGWTDVPLTDLGMKQASLLSKRLKHEKFGAIFCSDLLRAKETLKLSGAKEPVVFTPALREKNYGSLEGKEWGSRPEFYADHTDPFKKAEGGESAVEVQGRVVEYFERTILTCRAKTALIVSHHGPLVLLACHLLKMPIENWRAMRLGNAGLCRFEFEEERYRLTLWNSLSHLGMITNKKMI